MLNVQENLGLQENLRSGTSYLSLTIKFLKKIPYGNYYYHRSAKSNYKGFSNLDYKGSFLGNSLNVLSILFSS